MDYAIFFYENRHQQGIQTMMSTNVNGNVTCSQDPGQDFSHFQLMVSKHSEVFALFGVENKLNGMTEFHKWHYPTFGQ